MNSGNMVVKVFAVILLLLGVAGMAGAVYLLQNRQGNAEAEVFRQAEQAILLGDEGMEKAAACYRQYMSEYPQGRYVQEATARLANIEQSLHQKKAYRDLALLLQSNEWRDAVAKAKEFLRKYPQGPYSEQVRQDMWRIEQQGDDIDYKTVLSDSRSAATPAQKITALEHYFTLQPGDRHRRDIEQAVEEIRRKQDLQVLAGLRGKIASLGDDFPAVYREIAAVETALATSRCKRELEALRKQVSNRDVAGSARSVLDNPPAFAKMSAKDSFEMGAESLKEGKFEAARKWFEAARAEMSRAKCRQIDKVLRYVHLQLAGQLIEQKEWAKALRALDTALSAFPGDHLLLEFKRTAERENIPLGCRSYWGQGLKLKQQGKYEEAQRAFLAARGDANEYYQALIDENICFCKKRRFEDLYGQARSAFRDKDYETAHRSANQALAIKPDVQFLLRVIEESRDPLAADRFERASELLQNGSESEAVKLLDAALGLEPSQELKEKIKELLDRTRQ